MKEALFTALLLRLLLPLALTLPRGLTLALSARSPSLEYVDLSLEIISDDLSSCCQGKKGSGKRELKEGSAYAGQY